MNNGKGIAMPEEKVNGIPFEVLDTAKQIGTNILVQRSIEVLENTVLDNISWRERTYKSFAHNRLKEVSIEWIGGFDEDSLTIHQPLIIDVEKSEESNKKVIVHFVGYIPINKEIRRLN